MSDNNYFEVRSNENQDSSLRLAGRCHECNYEAPADPNSASTSEGAAKEETR